MCHFAVCSMWAVWNFHEWENFQTPWFLKLCWYGLQLLSDTCDKVNNKSSQLVWKIKENMAWAELQFCGSTNPHPAQGWLILLMNEILEIRVLQQPQQKWFKCRIDGFCYKSGEFTSNVLILVLCGYKEIDWKCIACGQVSTTLNIYKF